MAHFVKLDENNVVVGGVVIGNDMLNNLPFPESEPIGQAFIVSLYGEGVWKQTSYNRNFRKNYAGIGMSYKPDIDAFVYPQPFPSWVLDDNALWQAPIPYPTDGKLYGWDEATQSWVESA
jgi:hypothetical protein